MSTTTDLGPLKAVHRTTWASGDYTAVADAYVGEVAATALAAAQITPGSDVLDVAAGSGNATIPAALAGARVTGLDLVPELLAIGAERAAAEGVEVEWVEGDAEALPFADASFDTVLSVVGVQFAPSHEAGAREIARVTRPGGSFVLANWTPEGFIGQLFATMKPYMPAPPAGASAPPLWGDEDHVRALFAGHGVELGFERHHASFTAATPAAFVEFMATHYGPTLKARERLQVEGRWDALEADLIALGERFDTGDEGFLARSEYLLIRGRKQG